MPELVFYRRGDEVLRVSLERQRLVLGRGENSDVVLPDREVSRQQVELVKTGDQLWAKDLSGKGTLVSGQRVDSAALVDGADLQLGQWRAIYRATSGGGLAEVTQLDGTRTEQQGRETQKRLATGARVRIRRGDNETLRGFEGDTLSVGKDAANEIVLDDGFISARHLRITRKPRGFHVVDLQSTNGTFLGSIRIHDAEVPPYTILRVGETELTLEPVEDTPVNTGFLGMVGHDPSVRQLVELIDRVAPSNAAVAIFGESGTGKELVAHALHTRSSRSEKPFIPVNCAAISKDLIESELFGHEKGAFTGATNARKGAFEEADGGTLFLDEIGELPLELQAKLLRALESGEIKRVGASRPIHVDVRVVAATNRDLLAASREGRFREDLYYRLCVVPLHLPPLRSRRGDILPLAEHFLKQFSPRGQQIQLLPAAVERMKTHSWPGNIRELRNVVHRALLLRKGPSIDVADLSFDTERSPEVGVMVPEHLPGMTLEGMMEKLERQIVEAALRKYGNNRERVARELGVARSTLFKRLKDWGLTRQDEPESAIA